MKTLHNKLVCADKKCENSFSIESYSDYENNIRVPADTYYVILCYDEIDYYFCSLECAIKARINNGIYSSYYAKVMMVKGGELMDVPYEEYTKELDNQGIK